MKKKIALMCMLIVSVLCFSVFAISCSKPETKNYTVRYSVESQIHGSVSGTCDSGATVNKGNNVTLTATANSGYAFDGWYEGQTKVSSDNEYTFAVTKDIDLVAKFNVLQFTLNYSCQTEQGSIDSSLESGVSVDFNTQITLTATANEGYSFDGWFVSGTNTEECGENAYTFNMPANDYSLEARFTVNSYVLNVEFDAEQCDVNIADANSQIYQSGDNVPYNTALTITVTEKVGYDFVKIFSGESKLSTASVYSFNMPADEYNIAIELKAEKRNVQYISQSAIIKTEQVDFNTCATMYQPTRENHEFIGWYTDAGLNKLYDFNKKVVNNISLYAGWEESVKTYSVEFVDWNGKRIDTIQTVKEGESAIIPATPSREGYDFDEWVCVDGDYTCVEQNLVVKATYSVKIYDVKFYKDSAKTELYDTQSVEHGALAKIPTTIIAQNVLFDKWTYEDGIEFNFQTPVVGDLSLVATYKEKPVSVYEVKFYANDTLIDTQIVEANKTANEPSVIALESQKFIGWDKDITAPITTNTDFIAQFETKTFTVKFVDYNANVLDEQTINYAESAVAPQDPSRVGYKFIGWDKSFESVLEDLTITARYSVLSYVATYYDGSQYLGEITAEYGQAFTVPATPTKDGYSFDGWYSDSALTTKYDFTNIATADICIYAKFDEIELETYTVIFFVDNEPISTQEIYSGKDAVAPGIPTKVGHTFTGWEGDFTNVSADVNVSAIFTKEVYTVNFYEEDEITLIDSVSVDYGEQAIEPSAPSIDGLYFIRWSEDVNCVTGNMEVYAIYDSVVVNVYFREIDDSSISTASVQYNGNASIPRTPSKMGFIFSGWYVDKQFSQAFDFSTAITEDTTLYAKWEIVFDAFTVHFYIDGELYGSVQKVAEGKFAIEPALPNGYTVWKVEGTGEIFDFENTPITHNIILYAE